ncbi:MAG TPA: DUF3105 domain-containing protein [Acidimicrobiales bacterium]
MTRRHAAPLLAAALLAAALAGGCGEDDAGGDAPGGEPAGRPTSGGEPIGPAPEGIDGAQAYRIDSNDHTEETLAYQLVPPVGGEHFPVPATCGFYESDVPPDEMIVHDLEHGAIWIAFVPDLDEAQSTALRGLVGQQAKLIATPLDGLENPVVVSAWGRQLALDGVDDPRLQQFIDTYRSGGEAPEPGAACQGVGEPAVVSPAG